MIYHIWTDGSCRQNPGPGGFGILVMEKDEIIHTYNDTCEETTNNREEMKAILYAFEYAAARPYDTFLIHSDSAYCVNMCNSWIFTWVRNNWKNSKNKEVENIDLVKALYKYINKDFPNFQVIKTKGHVGIVQNELADALATNNLVKFNKIVEKNSIKIREL